MKTYLQNTHFKDFVQAGVKNVILFFIELRERMKAATVSSYCVVLSLISLCFGQIDPNSLDPIPGMDLLGWGFDLRFINQLIADLARI